MNKERRKQIDNVIKVIEHAKETLEDILVDEQIYFDAIPENLQTSEKATMSEEAIDNMTEQIDKLVEVVESLNEML